MTRLRLWLHLHLLLAVALFRVYLEEHPNRTYKQFRSPRRQRLSGVVVIHTAENTPDHVAFDGGAEAVASWISRRPDPGSYHTIVDSDSRIRMVEFDDEAFHDATSGGNRHEIGLSVATRADVWPIAPTRWRDGAIEQLAQAAAEAARHVYARTGIVVPARIITRAESERRVPGFISHALRDPARRTDPGRDFPWAAFLHRYAELTRDLGNRPPTQTIPAPRPGGLTVAQYDDLIARQDAQAMRQYVADKVRDDRLEELEGNHARQTLLQLAADKIRDARLAALEKITAALPRKG